MEFEIMNLEDRVADLERQAEEDRLRILSLNMAVSFLSNVINPVIGQGFSLADTFESAFSKIQETNPEDLDPEVLEEVKQSVLHLMRG